MIKLDIEDKYYPKRLRNIKNPPKIIFVEGNLENLNKIGLAVVGSRTCSCYGERICKKFSKELVEYDIIIISGLAKGIDTYSHLTAIENKGRTIAVLPSGLNKIYPKENEELVKKILENDGTIISEYEENEKADSKKFLQRNRIVSGLAIGTLIIEAGYRSGTSVTAKLAKEQGKNVFCIPSSLENIKGKGTNELIKKGCYLVTCAQDILEKYEDIEFERRNVEKKANVSDEFLDIYNILSDEPISIEKILRQTKLNISEINYKLMLMELDGLITRFAREKLCKKYVER